MAQLIAIGLIGFLIWYGYRAYKRETERVSHETREAEKYAKSKTVLKQGKDGVYRPEDN